MKHILILLFSLNLVFVFSQKTFIPDDQFEQYLIDLNIDDVIDDSVLTSNIETITHLTPVSRSIIDFTGIEDFHSLEYFDCRYNFVEALDLSSNHSLIELICSENLIEEITFSPNSALQTVFCDDNQLTEMDVSNLQKLELLVCNVNFLVSLDLTQNHSLELLNCGYNQILDLDLSENSALQVLSCSNNLFTSLDISSNGLLNRFWCNSSPIECLNMANGNNHNFTDFSTWGTPSLSCIIVDQANWTPFDLLSLNLDANVNIDASNNFDISCDSDCFGLAIISENNPHQPKELINIVNLLGQEVEYTPNTVLIYQYSDGTSEKVFTIED